MAGNPLPAEGVALSKSVQEMSISGDEPPPQFIVKESSSGFANNSPPSVELIPIIDINLLSSEYELEKLRSALSAGGCFQVLISVDCLKIFCFGHIVAVTPMYMISIQFCQDFGLFITFGPVVLAIKTKAKQLCLKYTSMII